MSRETKVSEVLRQAKRLVEAHPQSPDDALWQIVRGGTTPSLVFHQAKAYLVEAGDFPGAIALAEAKEE